ncbi:MAG TPA: prephenate dehydratase [Chloroflexota bacterium]|nr:prephenate dehydratase [Chloroflexota bacterium]
MTDLEALRSQFDHLDDQIVELLNQRAALSKRVGQVKGPGAPVYVPDRESSIVRRLKQASSGALPESGLEAVYREILSTSRALQSPPRVAFLGPAGTFSHQAAVNHFGAASTFQPVPTMADVFRETEVGRTDFGIVPIENSLDGGEKSTLDGFVDTELKACAEFRLDVHQTLMSRSALADVRTVCSHPNALGQCRDWLRQHLPNAALVEVSSTAAAAQQAAQREQTAAIAPEVAATLYDLNILEPRIEDASGNTTRFLVLGHEMSARTGRDRMSLLLSVRDRVGVLRDVLSVFVEAGVNLTKIESRPSKRRVWDYLFFLDLNAHPDDPGMPEALKRLEELTVFVKILGAWAQTA